VKYTTGIKAQHFTWNKPKYLVKLEKKEKNGNGEDSSTVQKYLPHTKT